MESIWFPFSAQQSINQSINQSTIILNLLQREGFGENEHNKHSNKKFVLVFRSADIFGMRFGNIFAIGNVGISVLFSSYRKQSDGRSSVSYGTDSIVAHNSNANSGSQTRTSGTKSGTQMSQATECTIGIFSFVRWCCDRLSDNDTNN